MSYSIFNREIKKVFKNENNLTITYVKEQVLKKSRSEDFHFLLSDLLSGFGINSLEYIPVINQNKYVPYINCREENIFNENSGITNLSDKPLNSSESQRLMANYLVNKLKGINVQTLKN